jgi:integrase
MAKGRGIIVRRAGSRFWWVKLYLPKRPGDRKRRRIEKSSKSERYSDALELLRKLESQHIEQRKPVTKGDPTFADGMAAVVMHYKLKGRKTLVDTERRIDKHLTPYFGGRLLADLAMTDFEAYATHRLKEGAKPASVNRELANMRLAYTRLTKAGVLHHRPVIELLAEDNVRQRIFSPDELARVLKELPVDLRPIVQFASIASWRISEVRGLTWDRVDRVKKQCRLDVGGTKSGDGRVYPYGADPTITAIIDVQWRAHKGRLQDKTTAGHNCPHVFTRWGRKRGPDGKYIVLHRNIGDFRKAFASACTRAGVPPGAWVHDLRRVGITAMSDAGVPRKVAMGLSGHKTERTFDRYHIVTTEGLAAAVSQTAAARLRR